MSETHLVVKQSGPLQGTVALSGAKNAVLVIMTSLILTDGKSRLTNVPASQDVFYTIALLKELGAVVLFDADAQILDVDTSTLNKFKVSHEIMQKMRASILVMGPLLARFGRAEVALPGGDAIGARPIDYHLKNFVKMGVEVQTDGDFLCAKTDQLMPGKLVLEYPSVGATENSLMAAVLTPGITRIINAALEPEVLDLIAILRKMGAQISILPPATLEIVGVASLCPVEHAIMYDRIEAGTLLLAAAITGGSVTISNACVDHLDIFLDKLQEMGHRIIIGPEGIGITLHATLHPRAVSFKTGPFPGFPTDLQAPMMVAQCVAQGTAVVEETVYENRLIHVRELQKMGAQIKIENNNKAVIVGVEQLYGAYVIASDVRAASCLVLAGLVAHGVTCMAGIHHLKRGHDKLEKKLEALKAQLEFCTVQPGETFDYDALLKYKNNGAIASSQV